MASKLAKLIGDKKLVRKLERLEKKAARRIEKKAIRAGAAEMKKAVKRNMPVDEGAAKRATDYKVTRKGAAVIGVDNDFDQGGRKPSKYIHLVEYGHVAADGTFVPGAHPIQRGAAQSEAAVAQKITDKAKSELDKLL